MSHRSRWEYFRAIYARYRQADRPWRFRTWIFPRDPAFVAKAGQILDLYEGGLGGSSAAGHRLHRVRR